MVRAWAPAVRRARRDDQRRRAGLHRHRDDGEDAVRHPRGRLPDQLAAAGRAAGRRRRDDRLARRSRAAPGSTARPCGSAASRCWGPDGRHRPRRGAEPRPGCYARAAVTARGRGGDLPDTRLARNGVPVDPAHLAAYARVCRLPLNDVLPATYPHMLTFPLQMALMSDRSFPLALPGLVHVRNRIDVAPRRSAPTSRSTSRCGPSTSPRHRSGATVDLCATASAGGEEVWRSRVDLPGPRRDGARRRARGRHRRGRRRPRAGRRHLAGPGRRRTPLRQGLRRREPDPPVRADRQGVRLQAGDRARHVGEGPRARRAVRPAARRARPSTSASASRCSCPSTVTLSTAQVDGGWDVAVRNATSGTEHVVGTIRPL